MISLFKTQRNFGGIYLVLLLLFVQTSRFLQMFVAGSEFSLFGKGFSLLTVLSSTIVIFGCGLLLNNILNRYQFFETKSLLGAAIFYCLSSFIPQSQISGWWLVALLISLLIFNKLAKVNFVSRAGRNFFDSAMLLGICCYIFPPYCFYFLALLIAMFVLTSPRWSYLQVTVIGLLFSAFFGGIYLFLKNEMSWFSHSVIAFQKDFLPFLQKEFIELLQPTILLVFLTIMSSIFWISRRRFLSDKQRPLLLFSTILAIMGIVLAILFTTSQLPLLLFTFFAFAVLISYLFYYMNANLAKLLFLLFTGYCILYPWVKHLNLDL